LNDGQLYSDDGHSVEIYEKGFCVDFFLRHNSNNNNNNSNQKEDNIIMLSVLICQNLTPVYVFPSTKSDYADCWKSLEILHSKLRIVFTFCGLVSILFLVVTIFLYLSLPELQNLKGRIVNCNAISIFFSTVLLVISFNIRMEREQRGLIKNQISSDPIAEHFHKIIFLFTNFKHTIVTYLDKFFQPFEVSRF
jgi:hypothetical protein